MSDLITYTPEEVAKMYKVSTVTIYKLIQEGKLLAKRISERQYRIPQSEVSWIKNGVDADLEAMEQIDLKILEESKEVLQKVRKGEL